MPCQKDFSNRALPPPSSAPISWTEGQSHRQRVPANALAVPRYSARLEDGILLNQLADPVDEGAHLCREVTALRIHYRDG